MCDKSFEDECIQSQDESICVLCYLKQKSNPVKYKNDYFKQFVNLFHKNADISEIKKLLGHIDPNENPYTIIKIGKFLESKTGMPILKDVTHIGNHPLLRYGDCVLAL